MFWCSFDCYVYRNIEIRIDGIQCVCDTEITLTDVCF